MRIRRPLISLAALLAAVAMPVVLVAALWQFGALVAPPLLIALAWLKAHHLLTAFSVAAGVLPGVWVTLWVIPAARKEEARRALQGDPGTIRRLPLTFGRN